MRITGCKLRITDVVVVVRCKMFILDILIYDTGSHFNPTNYMEFQYESTKSLHQLQALFYYVVFHGGTAKRTRQF